MDLFKPQGEILWNYSLNYPTYFLQISEENSAYCNNKFGGLNHLYCICLFVDCFALFEEDMTGNGIDDQNNYNIIDEPQGKLEEHVDNDNKDVDDNNNEVVHIAKLSTRPS